MVTRASSGNTHKTSSKEEKQMAISLAICEIIDREGLQGVTHSKVSRKSSVSRAWIYEYIGKEKVDLIAFAAEVLTSFFASAKKIERPQSKEELEARLIEGTDFVFRAVVSHPVIIKLHFRFRGTSNPIGDVIQKYEKYWLKAMSQSLSKILGMSPVKAAALAEMIQTLRLGFAYRIVTSENFEKAISEAQIAFEFLHRKILDDALGNSQLS